MTGRRRPQPDPSHRPSGGRRKRRSRTNTRDRKARDEPSAEGRVIVGEVRRPWGIHGALAVTSLSNDASRFNPGCPVYLDGRPTRIVEAYGAGRDATVIRVESISTLQEAEVARGARIEVNASELPAPPEGAYYHYQVLGARVRTSGGEDLGEIVEIVTTGANDVYVVRQKDAGDTDAHDILIPAIRSVILDVDPAAKLVTVDLLEGLR